MGSSRLQLFRAPLPSVAGGRDIIVALKRACEIGLTGKPGFVYDILDFHVCFLKKLCRFFQADFCQVIIKIITCLPALDGAQV